MVANIFARSGENSLNRASELSSLPADSFRNLEITRAFGVREQLTSELMLGSSISFGVDTPI